jgi:Protein tyrosine and serine/threonine kinase
VAVKVLSSESRQGVREFLTELTVISDINHENLVRLHGCCVEGIHRILVYPYMENNSLSQTLLGAQHTFYPFFLLEMELKYIIYHSFAFKYNLFFRGIGMDTC